MLLRTKINEIPSVFRLVRLTGEASGLEVRPEI